MSENLGPLRYNVNAGPLEIINFFIYQKYADQLHDNFAAHPNLCF